MSTLKQRLLTNWDAIRIFRLGIGIMLIVSGIQSKDRMLGLFSLFFLYQAITNTGCCGTTRCSTNPSDNRNYDTVHNSHPEEVEYEEVK